MVSGPRALGGRETDGEADAPAKRRKLDPDSGACQQATMRLSVRTLSGSRCEVIASETGHATTGRPRLQRACAFPFRSSGCFTVPGFSSKMQWP